MLRLQSVILSSIFLAVCTPAICQSVSKSELRTKSQAKDPLAMAIVYYHRSMWRQAIEAATDALSKPLSLNDKINALELRSESYLNLDDEKHSYTDINAAMHLRKVVPMTRYLRRANIEIALKMYSDAAKDLTILIKEPEASKNGIYRTKDGMCTTTEALFFQRASCYSKGGEFRKAIADYDVLLNMDPTSEEAFKMRGDCYAAIGQYKQAISDYTKAIANDRESPGTSYFARSVAYEKLGNKGQAEADKKRAAQLGYVTSRQEKPDQKK